MKERFSTFIRSPWALPIGVGLITFSGGVGLGYLLAKKKYTGSFLTESDQLEFDFDTEGLAEIQREMVREGYGDLVTNKEIVREERELVLVKETEAVIEGNGVLVVPGSTDSPILEGAWREEFNEVEDPDESEELVQVNVFEQEDTDWDWEKEVNSREENSNQPYIIHRDEFYRNEKDYSQMTLTFYEGDEIMVDEDNHPIYNHVDITGSLVFGHGSGDPNVVLIRNDERRAEYEILRDSGLYSVEVLGLEIENNERVKDVKHSKVGRFRME